MTDSRPNIICIMTDQQRYDTINALGYSYADTPHLDRLAAEGTTFTQCHVAGASCVPSRAALFTGYYPHTTGILKNGDLWRHTWVQRLADAGYHCVNVGKMHTEPMNTPAGFHERYNVENKERYIPIPGVNRDYFDEWDRALAVHGLRKPNRDTYRQRPDYKERLGAFEWALPPHLHPDVFVGHLATWWIKQYPKTEPLFLQIGFPGPHPPYDPLAEFARPYLEKDLPIDPVQAADLAGQPPQLLALRQRHIEREPDSVAHLADPEPAWRHRQRAYYLANVTMIDEKIGEILGALQDHGYLDNAVVVFTSDHGDCLGDHGHSQKWTCYEQITRMPLIVRGPGRIPAGRSIDALVQQFDLVPALFDYAGIPVPDSFETCSLRPALEGDTFVGREAVYCEQAGDTLLQKVVLMTMVRTPDWKLVHLLHAAEGQLFDLRNDLKEEVNLWNDPGTATVKTELLERLYLWRMTSQNHTRDRAAASR